MKIYKIIITFLLALLAFPGYTQTRITAKFANPTDIELSMKKYPKDNDAAGVILFESGKNSVEIINNHIFLIKKVHRKIKVIDSKKFKQSTVEIYLYNGKNSKEKISDLVALTHNGKIKTYVNKNAYYNINETDKWTSKKFTFNNIKDGSILEYKYTIESPYFFNFGNWEFQGDLPKIYSEFASEIPGNYIYNKVLIGSNKLYINTSEIKSNCFFIPRAIQGADCETNLYAMKDVPAFKEENYMLAKENYLATAKYELMTFIDFTGHTNKYTKTWKDVDKEFKNDKDIGKQLNHNIFFKKNITNKILTISNPLEKAKAIYTFIQNHYIWNGKFGIFSDARVKKAYEAKSGSISEINISLINALQAVDFDAKLVLLSTRDYRLPTLSFPVLTDFNYVVAFVKINEVDYLLDATNKFNTFGLLSFKALNLRGRVMDFKKGSYWTPLTPFKKNVNYINANLHFDEDEIVTGSVTEIYTGYMAKNKRKEINNTSKNKYIETKQKVFEGLEISNYSTEDFNNNNKPLIEKYSVSLDPEIVGNNIYIYPYFLQDYYSENPFRQEDRKYPISLGYPIKNTYILTLDIKDKYEVISLPKNTSLKLPENIGSCSVIYSIQNGKINLRLQFELNEYYFEASSYKDIKDFYVQVVDIQTKNPIVLKKIKN